MAYTNLSDLFKGICDAIRAKKGTTGVIKHQDIPSEIEGIETGADVSGVTASASDVVKGKKFVDSNGELVEGTVLYTSGINKYDASVLGYQSSTQQILLGAPVNEDTLYRSGSEIHLYRPYSDFGDANTSDVLYGKTFTSSAGFKAVGTYTPYIYGVVNGSSVITISHTFYTTPKIVSLMLTDGLSSIDTSDSGKIISLRHDKTGATTEYDDALVYCSNNGVYTIDAGKDQMFSVEWGGGSLTITPLDDYHFDTSKTYAYIIVM